VIGRWRRARSGPAPRRLIDILAGPLEPALALLFQDPSAARLVVDRHGGIVRASEPLRRLLGPATDLSPGRPLALLFAEAEREQAWAEIAPLLRGQARLGPPRPLSVRLAAPAPEPVTVSIAAVPVREADGTASGALLCLRDISQQTRLEAQLLHSQRLQAAGQLAGGVAHDFNNLLTAVLGAADAIAARAGMDAETHDDLAQIRTSAERGAALVRQLLAFGRRQTLQPRVLAINEVLEEMRGLLRRLLGSNIRLDLVLEQPGQRVRADPTALDQVLLNLAVNARDAMPEGGVLTLRTGHMTLYRPLPRGPETIPAGRYVMIEVADTGVGIPPEVQARMFEPFFTTRREQGGSGLGLATVHGIVRQSAGFLAVESEVGKGTRLRLYLPRWEGEEVAIPHPPVSTAPIPTPEPPPAAPAAPVRGVVLLVEDEPVVRRIAERALGRAGWTVLAAECGEEALALLERAPPPPIAAIVTDLMMPGQDGTELVRAVRTRLADPTLPAILVSGYAAEEVRQSMVAVLDAATLFLPKPYDAKALAARLAEVTAGRG
jgi:two-component system cell cycle sensor histidine kinase/response regulator CckA